MLVKALKLISGEELVGEVIHEEKNNDGSIKEIALKNPLIIIIQRDGTGNLGVGFVPFAPYLGKDVTFDFNESKFIFVMQVDDQMKNQYNSIFGGIVTPPKQILLS